MEVEKCNSELVKKCLDLNSPTSLNAKQALRPATHRLWELHNEVQFRTYLQKNYSIYFHNIKGKKKIEYPSSALPPLSLDDVKVTGVSETLGISIYSVFNKRHSWDRGWNYTLVNIMGTIHLPRCQPAPLRSILMSPGKVR